MPASAWIMFVFGCVTLYGGLALCLVIALKHRNSGGKKGD